MKQLRQYLKDTYSLSNYQISQIFFLFKTLASELSKIIIMGFIFHKQLALYFVALFIMLFVRSTMGGLHFYTYWSCLGASIIYLGLAIFILPFIAIPKYLQLAALLLCILVCNYIGPITSKYRPAECQKNFQKCKNFICLFIFVFALITYIMPESRYLTVSFWVIILHSLQLIVAKIRERRKF